MRLLRPARALRHTTKDIDGHIQALMLEYTDLLMIEHPMCPPASPAIENADILDLLMRKYSLHKQEIIAQITNYKAHSRHFQVIAAVLLVAIPLAIEKPQYSISLATAWPWCILVLCFTTIANYFLFDVIESQYAIQVLAARAKILEEKINELAHKRVLIWETAGAELFWSKKKIVGIAYPTRYLLIYQALIVVGFTLFLPLYVYWSLLSLNLENCWFSALVIVGMIYCLGSFALVVWTTWNVLFELRGRAKKELDRLSAEAWTTAI
jgi:hypothetical protein